MSGQLNYSDPGAFCFLQPKVLLGFRCVSNAVGHYMLLFSPAAAESAMTEGNFVEYKRVPFL